MATNYREALENPQKGNAKYITTRTIEVQAIDKSLHTRTDKLHRGYTNNWGEGGS